MSTARSGFAAKGSGLRVWQQDDGVRLRSEVTPVVFLIVILRLWACIILSLIDFRPDVLRVNSPPAQMGSIRRN